MAWFNYCWQSASNSAASFAIWVTFSFSPASVCDFFSASFFCLARVSANFYVCFLFSTTSGMSLLNSSLILRLTSWSFSFTPSRTSFLPVLVFLLHHHYLEHVDEFQVGSGSHIIESPQLHPVLITKVLDSLLHVYTDVQDAF